MPYGLTTQHEEELERVAAETGDTPASLGIRLTRGAGRSYLGAPDARHGTPLVTTLFDDRPGTTSKSIREMVRRLARRSARDLATGGCDATWTYDVHALVADHAAWTGIGAEEIARHCGEARKGRPADQTRTYSDTAGMVRMSAAAVDDLIVWDDAHRGAGLLLRTEVPDTIVAALAGRRLGEIASHAMLSAAMDAVVTMAESENGTLTLHLDPLYRPLAPAPPGVDEGWRTIPYHDSRAA